MNEETRALVGVEAVRQSFFIRVYAWMTLALCLTGLAAAYVLANPRLLMAIVLDRTFFFGLIIGELAIVLILSAAIEKLSATAATIGFLIYSVVNGLTLSVIFLVYTTSSIALTFFVTAAVFGSMCLYGHLTKRDLTSLGSLFLMALFGLGMLAGIVGLQFLSRVRAKWFIFKVGLLCAGGTLIWMSLITVMFMAYVAALVFGAAFSAIFLTGITMVQEVVADENRGKAFAVFHAVSRMFLLFGAAIAAALAGAVDDFHLHLGFYRLHVWGVTIAMFAAGVLIGSVAFLPLRERMEERREAAGHAEPEGTADAG